MSQHSGDGLHHFIKLKRSEHVSTKPALRRVYVSDIVSKSGDMRLCGFLANRLPAFYRDPGRLAAALSSEYFLTAVRETLELLPNAESFRESHFGEICSSIFAEDVLGLKRLYSKLSLLTSQNTNAFKMDLLLVDPSSNPLTFVMGEVKSSTKTEADGLPANHHKSCFAKLFESFNAYETGDLRFDLAAAKDRVDQLPQPLKDRVKAALEPYAESRVMYAGFVVIDRSTAARGETDILATRKNSKEFDVDLLRIQALPTAIQYTYGRLEAIREKCST